MNFLVVVVQYYNVISCFQYSHPGSRKVAHAIETGASGPKFNIITDDVFEKMKLVTNEMIN
jgi:hypothetical protein